jgi:hypothetical protein
MRGEELLDHSKRARRDRSRLSYMFSPSSSSRILRIFLGIRQLRTLESSWSLPYPTRSIGPPASRLDPVPSSDFFDLITTATLQGGFASEGNATPCMTGPSKSPRSSHLASGGRGVGWGECCDIDFDEISYSLSHLSLSLSPQIVSVLPNKSTKTQTLHRKWPSPRFSLVR